MAREPKKCCGSRGPSCKKDCESKKEAILKEADAKLDEVLAEAILEPLEPYVKPETIKELKGFKIIRDGKGLHLVDTTGRQLGHYADEAYAVRQLENLSRHIR